MIVLNAMAGLGNRLRAINSAIRLSRECGCPLRVFWVQRHDMKAAFHSLFEAPTIFEVKDIPRSTLCAKFTFSRLNPWHWDIQNTADFMASCRAHPSRMHFFSTFYDFHHNEDYSWLKPVADIQSEIDRLKALIEGTTGVHIRRTDNLHCLRYSPVELFFERIARDIDADAQARFFLCTDDDQVKGEMKRRFGDHIRTRDHVAARADANGVRDALVDMMLLARTKKLYGSYPSTFSHVAAQIGGTPLEFLTTREAEHAPYLKN